MSWVKLSTSFEKSKPEVRPRAVRVPKIPVIFYLFQKQRAPNTAITTVVLTTLVTDKVSTNQHESLRSDSHPINLHLTARAYVRTYVRTYARTKLDAAYHGNIGWLFVKKKQEVCPHRIRSVGAVVQGFTPGTDHLQINQRFSYTDHLNIIDSHIFDFLDISGQMICMICMI